MTTKLLTPRMGEGVDEVTVMQWLKNEGDTVKELEPLVEVETDKVVTEIPSPADGTLLKILVQPNSVAHVGEALAEIGAPGESVKVPAQPEIPAAAPAPVPQAAESAPADEAAASAAWISPLVRNMAAENHLDIGKIRGSGLGGRVTKQDVLDALSSYAAPRPVPQTPVTEQAVQVQAQARAMPAPDITEGEIVQLSPVRRQIAERMVASKQTSAHVLSVMEADLSRVLAHKSANQERFAAEGIHLTLTAYFIAAIASALREHPLANSSWTEQGILLHKQVNIGMAVSLGDAGLIVPVLKDASSLSLEGIARAVNDLAERARTKKLQPDEVRGGTFTLTNHGTGGSLFAMPIINQPQVGILGTGTVQKRAVVVTDEHGNDAIAIRPMVYLSFVFDHRVLDGASADAFLGDVKGKLEGEW